MSNPDNQRAVGRRRWETTEDPEESPVVLVAASDDGYAMPLAVALFSVLTHLGPGRRLVLYLIDSGISAANRRRLERVLQFNDVDLRVKWLTPALASLNRLKLCGHVTHTTYTKLLIPDLLPVEIERAIYLDCDVLVQADLYHLWNLDFDDKSLLAVQDHLVPYVSSPGGIVKYTALNLDMHDPYFNAGVLVFNLAKWRRERTAQRILDYFREYSEFVNVSDQDGLNAILAQDWAQLPPKWNVGTGLVTFDRWPPSAHKETIRPLLRDLLRTAYIHHFTGSKKPWSLQCPHPATQTWRAYLQRSGWSTPSNSFESQRGHQERAAARSRPRPEGGILTVVVSGNAECLKQSLDSVLAHGGSGVRITVIDQESSDRAAKIVDSLQDGRVSYIREYPDADTFAVWQRGLRLNESPYFMTLAAGDTLLPGFVENALSPLMRYPSAAFVAGPLERESDRGGSQDGRAPHDLSGGRIRGEEYLRLFVDLDGWHIRPGTVIYRTSAIQQVGGLKVTHSKQFFEVNLCLRLASRFNLVALDGELIRSGSRDSENPEPTFPLMRGIEDASLSSEVIEAIGYLASSGSAANSSFRIWLGERLQAANQIRSKLTNSLIPGISRSWREIQREESDEIAAVIPPCSDFLYAGRGVWVPESVAGGLATPFPEKQGQFTGPPPNDTSAIDDLERKRRVGFDFFVLGRSSFWWLDFYKGFAKHLYSNYPCISEDERLIIFDLRGTKMRAFPVPRRQLVRENQIGTTEMGAASSL